MKKDELQIRFKTEIAKSILLSENDKKYWLKQAPKLPKEILERVFDMVKTKNDEMEKYIKAAMMEDPSLIIELKNAMRKVKRNTLKAAEKEQEPNAEDLLNKNLSDL